MHGRVDRGLDGGRRGRGGGRAFGGRGAGVLHFAQPALEFEVREQLDQLLAVFFARGEIGGAEAEVEIGRHGHQLAAERQKVEVLAQVLTDLAAHLIGAGDDVVQRAELVEPFHGRLGAAFVHAGDVVDRVAHQREVVDDALGRHAELGLDASRVEHFVAHGVDPAHALVDQLGEIFVAGGNHHVHTGSAGLAGERADHIVGLDALDHQQRPAARLHGRVQRGNLHREVFGHGRAMRFVIGKPVVAKGLALGVENAGAVLRLVVGIEPT